MENNEMMLSSSRENVLGKLNKVAYTDTLKEFTDKHNLSIDVLRALYGEFNVLSGDVVMKETGKGLSTNDFTDVQETFLVSLLESNEEITPVSSAGLNNFVTSGAYYIQTTSNIPVYNSNKLVANISSGSKGILKVFAKHNIIEQTLVVGIQETIPQRRTIRRVRDVTLDGDTWGKWFYELNSGMIDDSASPYPTRLWSSAKIDSQLDLKVPREPGKGLSTNDLTDEKNNYLNSLLARTPEVIPIVYATEIPKIVVPGAYQLGFRSTMSFDIGGETRVLTGSSALLIVYPLNHKGTRTQQFLYAISDNEEGTDKKSSIFVSMQTPGTETVTYDMLAFSTDTPKIDLAPIESKLDELFQYVSKNIISRGKSALTDRGFSATEVDGITTFSDLVDKADKIREKWMYSEWIDEENIQEVWRTTALITPENVVENTSAKQYPTGTAIRFGVVAASTQDGRIFTMKRDGTVLHATFWGTGIKDIQILNNKNIVATRNGYVRLYTPELSMIKEVLIGSDTRPLEYIYEDRKTGKIYVGGYHWTRTCRLSSTLETEISVIGATLRLGKAKENGYFLAMSQRGEVLKFDSDLKIVHFVGSDLTYPMDIPGIGSTDSYNFYSSDSAIYFIDDNLEITKTYRISNLKKVISDSSYVFAVTGSSTVTIIGPDMNMFTQYFPHPGDASIVAVDEDTGTLVTGDQYFKGTPKISVCTYRGSVFDGYSIRKNRGENNV